MQNKSAAGILALPGQMKNQSSVRIHTMALPSKYMAEPVLRMTNRPFTWAEPLRMINIHHTRQVRGPELETRDMVVAICKTFVPRGNYKEGDQKSERKI
jgi:hypothetical protein